MNVCTSLATFVKVVRRIERNIYRRGGEGDLRLSLTNTYHECPPFLKLPDFATSHHEIALFSRITPCTAGATSCFPVPDGRWRKARLDRRPSATFRLEHTHRRRRIGGELPRRANRPRGEVAAAVGTLAAESRVYAIATERALECADHGVGGVRRQILVTAFAVRSKREHGESLPK
jgi:hypothetical protein